MRTGLLAVAVALAALGAAPIAQAQVPASRAVVLVSGFTTSSPFTVSAASCAGQEGSTWSNPNGPAAALRAAGFNVFTAPVQAAKAPLPLPCTAGGAVPPASLSVNSNGDVNQNGANLGGFLAFLRTNYGITTVDLVGHSDGGLWSRSAITQQANFAGVTVASLTTLGTPHTGSYVADLIEEMNGAPCNFSNKIEQFICEALIGGVEDLVESLGPTAVNELTSDYLETWNPEQSIGACPVAGAAGTHVDLPIPSFLLSNYYNPNDGVVGQASALAQSAKNNFSGNTIPAPGLPTFQSLGSFDAVHSPSLSFIFAANLLNTTAISQAVTGAVQSAQTATVPCAAPPAPPTPPTPPSPTPTPGTDGIASVNSPLAQLVPSGEGLLGSSRRGDVIVSNARARITCGGRGLGSSALLGSGKKLKVTLPGRCKGALRVTGNGARVILVRHPGSYVSIDIAKLRLSVAVKRAKAKRVQAFYATTGRFRAIRLDRKGAATLPAGTGPARVRVVVTTRDGDRLAATATASR